ncbi:MAG: YkgJ family cysteine cluster protein [Pseudomonadota bacterium]|nr:YkgJ family cysteine cluster protein [Pseudomonadota bacterium]
MSHLLLDDCQSCGACCASFRVDFAVYETQAMGGNVPDGLAEPVNGNTCRMRGTDHVPLRCAALTGRVGERVACAIYEWRPSPCREFASDSHACRVARRRHALPVPDDDPHGAPAA